MFGENLPLRKAVEFYQHPHNWSNRLIAGDSLLVMNSLLEKEAMGGQFQMIYIDPPYGIKYGSNFQPFVEQREVTDSKDEHLTGAPPRFYALAGGDRGESNPRPFGSHPNALPLSYGRRASGWIRTTEPKGPDLQSGAFIRSATLASRTRSPRRLRRNPVCHTARRARTRPGTGTLPNLPPGCAYMQKGGTPPPCSRPLRAPPCPVPAGPAP